MSDEYKGEYMEDHNTYWADAKVKPPVRGDSAYGPGKWNMAKKTTLDANAPVIGGTPTFDDGFGMEGGLAPSTNARVGTKNSDTTLMATASNENLSKKYKYPGKSQDTVADDLVAKPGSSI